jgi:hypothetical protein
MIEDEILSLERALLTREVRASATRLDNLLSDDFREFGSSGLIFTKEQIIPLLLENPSIQAEILDFQVRVLTPQAVHATYRAAGSLRSSLWIRDADRWRMLFHQGTRLATSCDENASGQQK